MKKILQTAKQHGLTVLVAGISSIVVSSAILHGKVDDYVEAAHRDFKVEFVISCDEDGQPADIPKVFSKDENFTPKNKDKSLLEKKIGFEFETDNLVCDEMGRLFGICVGQEYKFTVEDGFSEAYEDLTIFNYSEHSDRPTSMIVLQDNNHDGVLDYISINDRINNTSILIKRNVWGNLEYDNITEEGAKQLFDLYNLEYNKFKMEHKIDLLILEYEPKLEIKEIKPPK